MTARDFTADARRLRQLGAEMAEIILAQESQEDRQSAYNIAHMAILNALLAATEPRP